MGWEAVWLAGGALTASVEGLKNFQTPPEVCFGSPALINTSVHDMLRSFCVTGQHKSHSLPFLNWVCERSLAQNIDTCDDCCISIAPQHLSFRGLTWHQGLPLPAGSRAETKLHLIFLHFCEVGLGVLINRWFKQHDCWQRTPPLNLTALIKLTVAIKHIPRKYVSNDTWSPAGHLCRKLYSKILLKLLHKIRVQSGGRRAQFETQQQTWDVFSRNKSEISEGGTNGRADWNFLHITYMQCYSHPCWCSYWHVCIS